MILLSNGYGVASCYTENIHQIICKYTDTSCKPISSENILKILPIQILPIKPLKTIKM